MMTAPTCGRAQYLLLSGALMRLPGRTFEVHGHPAVVLDIATGPRTRVWGWWAPETAERPAVPCLLWAGELGWSATAVEPDMFDSEGWERAFWSHRIKLLDLALAGALGPFPTLEDLQLQVTAEADAGPGYRAEEVTGALLWGILRLRAARARQSEVAVGARPRLLPPFVVAQGMVDEELSGHDLGPDVVKTRVEGGDRGLAALLQAVNDVPAEPRRQGWSLHGWRPALPRLHRSGSRQTA
jgi:hypothetical protein